MRVPEREQWLAAGCALGNFMNAAHQLGFGAIMLSGERCFNALLCAELGLDPTESLAGFISLGSIKTAAEPRKPTMLNAVRAFWQPGSSPESSGSAADSSRSAT
ncbi:Nitroreductase family [Comamonas testosteroni]|uniref:Nitroreductase family n=2 Tax=Comamonas testosteroni TaxID=285 RepID=A0A8B4S294_COMTE|nr:Nitroreductase family [Comamonas testosteroni]